MGAFAGTPGALIGAVLGGAVGVVAGRAIEVRTAEEDAEQDELDHTIGIIGGDLGARETPLPKAPESMHFGHDGPVRPRGSNTI